ncbi:MAG: ATP-binding protein [Candidatus Glassbacteria bacterium]
MTDYLAAYGTISQAADEAVDHLLGLKAKIKGKCFGPSRELQAEVRGIYRREIDERLQLISRLIVELGENRPRRFAVALSRLSLNLGDTGEQMVGLLYLPGYRSLQKMAIALLDHLQRSLVYFRKTITRKEDSTTFNVNYLLRDIALAGCPWRGEFLPAGDERMVAVSFREKLDEEVPHMVGEADAVYLALYQIVNNAVTAATGGGMVSTYTRYYDRFRQLQITVADNGAGVDRIAVLKSALEAEVINPKEADGIRQDTSDHNNRVFELMFQPRVSGFSYRNKSFKGIGLALAREEIIRHRGKIEVYSKPGRGTTIQIFFTVK